MSTQWEKRVKVFQTIYGILINDVKEGHIIEFLDEQELEFDAEFLKIFEYLETNLSKIIEILKPNIADTWTWERICYTDKAILIAAYAEFKTLDTPRNVIIDQSLVTAKNHSIDNSYKFINPILEKVLKDE